MPDAVAVFAPGDLFDSLKEKSMTGCSFPTRFRVEASRPRW